MSRHFDHRDRRFTVQRGVFDPVRHLSGIAFADALPALLTTVAPEARSAIDLGTGCGVLAATLAKHGCRVTATDVSRQAVRCARRNCFGLAVDVRHGDLFEPLQNVHADVLVVNPPYGRRGARLSRSAAFTSADFLERFAAEYDAYVDRILLGFPAEDASILAEAGLDLHMIDCLPTAGASLGIFTQ